MILLYNLLWPIGLLFFLPGFFLKMFRRGGYRKNFGQRLALYRTEVRVRLNRQRPIWIHAVSVGEVMIALKLAGQLHIRRPDLHFALTTTTTTGYSLATQSAPPWMTVLYTPLDFWPVMRRAFRTIAPRGIVLVEAEVWPNMLTEATRRNIPTGLINARLSVRSEQRFARFKFLFAPVFQKLSLLCMPDAEDQARWGDLGVLPERIRIVGNIKYDPDQSRPPTAEPRLFLDRLGVDAGRPVLFGGSTHVGEEEILADAFTALRQEFPSLFLVIAPRHVERGGEIESRLRKRGLRIARRAGAKESSPDLLLIDTTGELADWYSIATVVFIGKSLIARGGQNPVEAIVMGKPVIIGPHMENFAALVRQLTKNRAVLCAGDGPELISHARSLLSDAALRERTSAAATKVIAYHCGATARTAELILALSAS